MKKQNLWIQFGFLTEKEALDCYNRRVKKVNPNEIKMFKDGSVWVVEVFI